MFYLLTLGSGSGSDQVVANEQYVEELVGMGFDRDLAIYMLIATDNNLVRTPYLLRMNTKLQLNDLTIFPSPSSKNLASSMLSEQGPE